MKILIMDDEALSLDWSLRCIEDGHKVKWYSTKPKSAEIGKGMVERVDNPHDWYRWADLIFFADNSKWLDIAEAWKKQGWPVIVGSKESIEWETDRKKGQDVLKKAGIPVIDFREFSEYDAAIQYVEKTMKRYVSKPNDCKDKSLSYCSKTPEDMIYMLERWKGMDKLKSSFILQEFVEGCEMSAGGWFGPGGFSQGWHECWEFKKLMNDDLGVATGEQGSVLRVVKQSKLADKVLKPLEEQLAKAGFIGNVDVNCIIDAEGNPWPIEFTMRPGWPTFNIQQALHKGDRAEWLMDLWEGKDARNWEMNKIAVGVVMSIPDYPYSHLTKREVQGIPIYGDLNKPCIHLCECKMGEAPVQSLGRIVKKPHVVTAGDYLLVVSGVGDTVSEAKRSAYRELKSLKVPNSPMYRTDIGNRLKRQLPELQKHGYATGMEF